MTDKKSAAVLQKVNRRAKQIVKENPQISYRDAQRQAGIERREGVGAIKRKRSTRPRSSVGAKYRVRHVVEKIGASQIAQTRKQLETELKQQRAWELLALDSARSVKEKQRARKALAENKKELKAISGRKASSPKKKRRR